jgi:hypothetical protein
LIKNIFNFTFQTIKINTMSKEEKKQPENALQESVNDQITDAAQQSNVINVGEHPASPYSKIYLDAGLSTGLYFQNAISDQNNQNILGQAATNLGVYIFIVCRL